MTFETKVKGTIIDEKKTTKGKLYYKLYDGNNLINVFSDRAIQKGPIELTVKVSAKDAFVQVV